MEGEGNTQHPPPSTRRTSSRHREGQPAKEGEEEPEPKETSEEPKEVEEDRGSDRETPWGPPFKVTRMGRDATPPEEKADLP